MQCSNKLKQLALAAHNHHDVFNRFPDGSDRYEAVLDPADTNPQFKEFSGHVFLLPFIEQSALYEGFKELFEHPYDLTADYRAKDGFHQLRSGNGISKVYWLVDQYRLADAAFLACPSDNNGNQSFQTNFDSSAVTAPSATNLTTFGRSGNYTMSMGDYAIRADNSGDYQTRKGAYSRGPFQPIWETALSDITDGTSNTAMYSERACGDGVDEAFGGSIFSRFGASNDVSTAADSLAGSFRVNRIFNPSAAQARRSGKQYVANIPTSGWAGTLWYSSAPSQSWYNHILPPNSPSFASVGRRPNEDPHSVSMLPPTSYHTGGVNLARCDASVAFVTETIDCGNQTGVVSATDPTNNGRASAAPHYWNNPAAYFAANDSSYLNSTNSKGPGSPSNFGVWGAFGSRDGGEATAMP
jgi:hypothetical protein